MSKLYFRYGAMNCGKTTHLLQLVYNYSKNGIKGIVMKPLVDTKGGEYLESRLGISRKVDFLIDGDTDIYDIAFNLSIENKYIVVDEAQFLTRNQVDQLLHIVIDFNMPVFCYGLRTDFKTNGFEGSTRLLEIAHDIEELKTICKCGKKAIFNARKINDKFIINGHQVAIDGKDNVTYEPLCATCYFEALKRYLKNEGTLF